MNRVIISLLATFALSSVLAACASEPEQEAVAESSEAFSLGPLGPSHCVVSQPVCRYFPQYGGTFEDDWTGSGVNPERCMQRAAEYSLWCGNPTGVPTHVVFEAPAAGVHVENLYIAQ